MSAAHAEQSSANGMVTRLDEMLAELANAAVIPGYGRYPASWPGKSSPRVGDGNGGTGSSPHPQKSQTDAARLSAATQPGAASTAGWPNSSRLRDQTCRDPFCDAPPIRHIDDVIRHRDGGPTTFTNGRGVCARGNLIRETPGWQIKPTDCSCQGEPHKIIITTPTGHNYLSRAPDPP
jgi:hypothetical protein